MTGRGGSGAMGNCKWALRKRVARDRTAAFGPQEQTQAEVREVTSHRKVEAEQR